MKTESRSKIVENQRTSMKIKVVGLDFHRFPLDVLRLSLMFVDVRLFSLMFGENRL